MSFGASLYTAPITRALITKRCSPAMVRLPLRVCVHWMKRAAYLTQAGRPTCLGRSSTLPCYMKAVPGEEGWVVGGRSWTRERENRKRWRRGCSYCVISCVRGVAGAQRLTGYVRMRGNRIEMHPKNSPLSINPTGKMPLNKTNKNCRP